MKDEIISTVHGVPGRGFQKRATVVNPLTGRIRCHRAGGIPYAQQLTLSQRWKRAKALPSDFHYGTKENPKDCTGYANECPQPGLQASRPSEDCLQLNIWVPGDEKPERGWPVFFYIPKDGGFLQWGSPNWENPSALLSETSIRAIIVCPSYRLNAFGFLASRELQAEANGGTVGNLGFWDQRLALEWTHANIALYGGDPSNITVGGLSAGAHSTFHQLAFEAALPDSKACIRRVVMWSNGSGLPPKPIHEVQSHFDALLSALSIPMGLSAELKLRRLRSLSTEALVRAVSAVPENAFRSVTDGAFVRQSLFSELQAGSLGRTLRRRGVELVLGDVRDEFNSYRLVSPPSSYGSLVARLAVEYPEHKAEKLARIYCPNGELPKWAGGSWQNVFGRIYADFQVHVTERGLVAALASTLPASSVHRYRIEWRALCTDRVMKPEMGVAHGSDLDIWWFGNGKELLAGEKQLVSDFLAPWSWFLKGESTDWGTKAVDEVRMIGPSGTRVDIKADEHWNGCLKIWNAIFGIGESRI